MILGKIIERSSNVIKFDSPPRTVSLDEYHGSLPIEKGDVVIINNEGKLLVMIPTDNASVKSKNYNTTPTVAKDIFKSIESYITKTNYSPATDLDNIIASFLNNATLKDRLPLIINSVPKEETRKFSSNWLKTHLFRQFALWGLSDKEARLLIEDMSICKMNSPGTHGTQASFEIEDLMITLANYPARFLGQYPEITDQKIAHLENIFGCKIIPDSIARLKRQLKRTANDSYLPFRAKDEIALGSKKNSIGLYGLIAFDENTKIANLVTYKLEEFVSKIIQSKIAKSNYEWRSLRWMSLGNLTGLSSEQQDGVKMVFNSQVSIITGGPGTGKTKLVHGIIKEAIARGIKYHVAAFTGKAVGRVKETAFPEQIEASTLDMMFIKGPAVYDFNLLILEEASMITTKYIYRLFQKFNPIMYQIVLVGDLDQIPPLEKGQFFSSLLWSKRVPYLRLSHNYRVDQVYGGDIVKNAQKIVDPMRNLSLPIELDSESVSFNVIRGGMKFVKDVLYKIDPEIINSMTVLTPYNVDVTQINKIFQSIKYNSKDESLDSKFARWYLGDRIMVVENEAARDIANGDLGYVSELSGDSFKVVLDKDPDVSRVFGLDEADKKLKHSYCFTINKSQGSEYNTVMLYLPINESNGFFLNLNMIYTAITRAKKMVWVIVESPEILINACNRRIAIPKDILKDKIISRFPDKDYVGTLVEVEEVEDCDNNDDGYGDIDWDD
jgi:hypothetical protein